MSALVENPATVEDVVRGVRIKSIISDAVEDGVQSALRKMEEGRDVADEAILGAQNAAKQNLLQSMGIVFAVGVMTGAIAAWIGWRRY